jgi:hypothetical protein
MAMPVELKRVYRDLFHKEISSLERCTLDHLAGMMSLRFELLSEFCRQVEILIPEVKAAKPPLRSGRSQSRRVAIEKLQDAIKDSALLRLNARSSDARWIESLTKVYPYFMSSMKIIETYPHYRTRTQKGPVKIK